MPTVEKLPSNMFRQAEKKLGSERWSEAEGLLNAVLEKHGRRTPRIVYARLAQCYRKLGQFDKAEKIIRKGLRRHSTYVTLKVEEAELAMSQKNWSRAEKIWTSILNDERNGTPLIALIRLSQAYRAQSEWSNAKEVTRRGLQMYKSNRGLLIEEASIASSEENWQVASSKWQKILTDFPDKASIDVYVNLIKALRNLSRYKEAEVLAKKALKIFPNEWKVLREMAEISNNQGRWVIALRRWKILHQELNRHEDVTSSLIYTRFNVSVLSRLADIQKYKKDIKNYLEENKRLQKDKKIVVYTALTEGYDSLKPPGFLDPRIDYIAFANYPLEGMGIYEIRKLGHPDLDGARAIRYPKTHPHILFPEYEAAVWVDASLMITDDLYAHVRKFLKSGKVIASSPHADRRSLNEEFRECLELGKDSRRILKKQKNFYRRQRFVPKDRLAENGMLIFDVKNRKITRPLETWWDQILRFSKRDQLSFNYSLEKNGISYYHLVSPGGNIRNHPALVFAPHHSTSVILETLQKAII